MHVQSALSQKIIVPSTEPPALEVKDLNFWYGPAQALKDIPLQIPPRRITAIIGPSGCG